MSVRSARLIVQRTIPSIRTLRYFGRVALKNKQHVAHYISTLATFTIGLPRKFAHCNSIVILTLMSVDCS